MSRVGTDARKMPGIQGVRRAAAGEAGAANLVGQRPLRSAFRWISTLLLALSAGASAASEPPATFSVDYVVRISRGDPGKAHVRWVLAGIDEIRSFRLVFRDDRASDVSGTGRLEWRGRTLRWTPGGPYAHLRYTVAIDNPRGTHLDSHASGEWVATRALYLFPEINVMFSEGAQQARSRARLIFRLPRGWKAAAALEELGGDTFRVDEPGMRFDRPRGWFLLGNLTRQRRRIGGMDVTVAIAPGSALDGRRLLRLYARIGPHLAHVLGAPPARLLVVSAPDPMWHGGLSGEDSFFVNGRIPLRSADKTSTYLHELFHVWQPFRPAPDAQWVSEGLAEYYSVVLQRRAGRLSEASFARGITLFARYGHFGGDLTRAHDAPTLNNSAPLVMHHLDREIQKASAGRRSLDDAVRALARARGRITTQRFLRAVNHAARRDLTTLFSRWVTRGERPPDE
jgi:predicted metalloprotease with PDZ domain